MVIFFGHHKCATQWVSGILESVSIELGLRFRRLPQPMVGGQLRDFVRQERLQVLLVENASIEHAETLDDFLGFHIIRDPRDIIVSGYFSHKKSHTEESIGQNWLHHRERLNMLSKELGLVEEIEFARPRLLELDSWDFTRPNIMEVKFEDLTFRPYCLFLKIFEFLNLIRADELRLSDRLAQDFKALYNRSRLRVRGGLRLPGLRVPGISAERLLGVVHRNRFEVKASGRRLGDEDPGHHYRKGQPGDWENHLTPQHLQQLESNHPGMLQRLGYARKPIDISKGDPLGCSCGEGPFSSR